MSPAQLLEPNGWRVNGSPPNFTASGGVSALSDFVNFDQIFERSCVCRTTNSLIQNWHTQYDFFDAGISAEEICQTTLGGCDAIDRMTPGTWKVTSVLHVMRVKLKLTQAEVSNCGSTRKTFITLDTLFFYKDNMGLIQCSDYKDWYPERPIPDPGYPNFPSDDVPTQVSIPDSDAPQEQPTPTNPTLPKNVVVRILTAKSQEGYSNWPSYVNPGAQGAHVVIILPPGMYPPVSHTQLHEYDRVQYQSSGMQYYDRCTSRFGDSHTDALLLQFAAYVVYKRPGTQ